MNIVHSLVVGAVALTTLVFPDNGGWILVRNGETVHNPTPHTVMTCSIEPVRGETAYFEIDGVRTYVHTPYDFMMVSHELPTGSYVHFERIVIADCTVGDAPIEWKYKTYMPLMAK